MIKASDFITRVQGVKAKAGYIIKDSQSSSVLYFFNLSDSSIIPLSDVYIPDTQVQEPAYHGSSGGSATGMDFYKCTSVNTSDNTWSGYKLLQNTDNGYTLQSQSTLIGAYYVKPTVDKIYDTTGKLQLKTYYGGDNHDPYGDGLLYSIFINGGEAWSAPKEGIVTTDNYTSNVETFKGITARKFNGNEMVTTTKGTQRTVYSYSIWIHEIVSGGYVCGTQNNICSIYYLSGWPEFMVAVGDAHYRSDYSGVYGTSWTHIVLTRNGNDHNLYLNGIKAYTKSKDRPSSFTDGGFCFGNETSEASNFSNGYIANFRYYDHALTSSEIAALYEELTPSN